jgi:hypothetical protein
MPSVSRKQERFMQAAAHNPDFAKRAKIPMFVAMEFAQADKGKQQMKNKTSVPNANRRGRRKPKGK